MQIIDTNQRCGSGNGPCYHGCDWRLSLSVHSQVPRCNEVPHVVVSVLGLFVFVFPVQSGSRRFGGWRGLPYLSVLCKFSSQKKKKKKNGVPWWLISSFKVKGPVLSLLWHGFHTGPRNFCMLRMRQKKKRDKKNSILLC